MWLINMEISNRDTCSRRSHTQTHTDTNNLASWAISLETNRWQLLGRSHQMNGKSVQVRWINEIWYKGKSGYFQEINKYLIDFRFWQTMRPNRKESKHRFILPLFWCCWLYLFVRYLFYFPFIVRRRFANDVFYITRLCLGTVTT